MLVNTYTVSAEYTSAESSIIHLHKRESPPLKTPWFKTKLLQKSLQATSSIPPWARRVPMAFCVITHAGSILAPSCQTPLFNSRFFSHAEKWQTDEIPMPHEFICPSLTWGPWRRGNVFLTGDLLSWARHQSFCYVPATARVFVTQPQILCPQSVLFYSPVGQGRFSPACQSQTLHFHVGKSCSPSAN